jgi:hypothetical protein
MDVWTRFSQPLPFLCFSSLAFVRGLLVTSASVAELLRTLFGFLPPLRVLQFRISLRGPLLTPDLNTIDLPSYVANLAIGIDADLERTAALIRKVTNVDSLNLEACQRYARPSCVKGGQFFRLFWSQCARQVEKEQSVRVKPFQDFVRGSSRASRDKEGKERKRSEAKMMGERTRRCVGNEGREGEQAEGRMGLHLGAKQMKNRRLGTEEETVGRKKEESKT